MYNLCRNIVSVRHNNMLSSFSLISPYALSVIDVPTHQKVIDSLVMLGFEPSENDPEHSFEHPNGISVEFMNAEVIDGYLKTFMDPLAKNFSNEFGGYNYDPEYLDNFKLCLLGTLNDKFAGKGFGEFGMEFVFPKAPKQVEQDKDPLDELTFEE